MILKYMKGTKRKLTLATTPEMNTVGLGGLENKRIFHYIVEGFHFVQPKGKINKTNNSQVRLYHQFNNRHRQFWAQIHKKSHNYFSIPGLTWLHQLVHQR